MQTDKLFTCARGASASGGGQQREADAGSVLVPYNSCPEQRRRNGARFYSALTGRFLSPDPLIAAPGDPQMLNRYSYVRNNPLVYVDPTGLEMAVVCGWGQSCESLDPGALEEYKEWVIWYWIKYEHMDPEEARDRWDALMEEARDPDTTWDYILSRYDVLFITTETNQDLRTAVEIFLKKGWQYLSHVEGMLALIELYPEASWDVVLGYSLGGAVVAWSMYLGAEWRAGAVILIEPAMRQLGVAWEMDARRFPDTLIMTLNAPGTIRGAGDIGGAVAHAINIAGSCGSEKHCTMQDLAPLAMTLAYWLPPGAFSTSDPWTHPLLRGGGFTVCIAAGYWDTRCLR